MKNYKCDVCDDSGELNDGSACQECCIHDDHDGHVCLICNYELELSDLYVNGEPDYWDWKD